MHQRRHHRGEDDGVHPLVNRLVGLAAFAHAPVAAPDVAVEEARDVEVVDDRKSEQQPKVARPDHEPKRIEQCGEGESHPLVSEESLDFSHLVSVISIVATGRPCRIRPACRREIRPP